MQRSHSVIAIFHSKLVDDVGWHIRVLEDRLVSCFPNKPNQSEKFGIMVMSGMKFNPSEGVVVGEEGGRPITVIPKAMEAGTISEHVEDGFVIRTAAGT